MRAVILAAGTGSRLGNYTRNLPKGMLSFWGKSLLQHQVDAYNRAQIHDIVIVTGFKATAVDISEVTYRHNPRFETTNMVESLMAARDLLAGDLIISYADVIVENGIVERVKKFTGPAGVLVDMKWQKYWHARYGRLDFDTESLQLDDKGKILQLGTPDAPMEKMDGRYVGMLRFSPEGTQRMLRIYDREKRRYAGTGPWRNSRNFENGYMTDLVQALIDDSLPVHAIPCENGWLEFDTAKDYETYQEWLRSSTLESFIGLAG